MKPKELQKLAEILKSDIKEVSQLSGKSGDLVFLVESEDSQRYVYKTGTKESIAPQLEFYKKYLNLPYLPELIYAFPDSKSFVISYIEHEKNLSY
jgi:hypothetical protein